MTAFTGLPKDFFAFFRELAANNDRDWFAANKQRYQDVVVNPVTAFIVDMGPRLRRISPRFVADPRPHGGSMFRIYRDTRFSADKSPYKTHAGVQFRHEAGRDAHAPSFYLHLGPEGLFFGGGVWRPAGPQLARIREFIVDNARSWSEIVDSAAVRSAGGIRGESLKRPPRGYDPDHAHVDDLKRKSHYLVEEAPPETALEASFIDRVEAAFRRAAPMSRFFCQALGLPF